MKPPYAYIIRWTVCLSLLLGGLPSWAQTYSTVENHETEVILFGPNDLVCKEKRVITVQHEKGRYAAHFFNSYRTNFSTLRKFSGQVTDANGKVIHKIKKSDLQTTAYSAGLADDVVRMFYEYTPTQYPFTITYEWEEKLTDGILSLPTFAPIEGYNQELKQTVYKLTIPADMPYRYRALCCVPTVNKQTLPDGRQQLEVRIENMPALISEPFGPSLSEVLPRVYFVPENFTYEGTQGNMTNWQTFGDWIYGLLQGRDELPPALVQKLQEQTAACQTDRERVKVVYDLLAATTRYVSIQLGIGGLQPAPAADVYRTGYGDCKALANYAHAMLKALGIPSVYTVISTNNERFLPDFASANQANHVILQVPLPGDTLWLECTAPTLPFGYVHNGIAGHDALLIKPEGGELCRLPSYPDSLNIQITSAVVELTPEGKSKVDVQQRSSLFQYEDNSGITDLPLNKQKDRLRSDISLVQADVSDIRIDEQSEAQPSIDIRYTVTTDKYGTQTGKRLFLPANIFHRGFSGAATTAAPRTQEVKVSYGYTDIDSIEIRLPEGFEIESLPAPVIQETPFGSFQSIILPAADKITILQRLHVKKGRYPKEEYANFIAFRKKAADQYKSKIIIRKKE